MANRKNKYTVDLVELVKATGQELINRAEELVLDSNLLTDFTITCHFPCGDPDRMLAEIDVNYSIINQEAFERIKDGSIFKINTDEKGNE